jgi:plastocyanin
MRHGRPIGTGLVVGMALVQLALPAFAQNGDKALEGPVTRAEFTKLQSDVREQRQLIIQMLQTEQQRYDMLLHLLQGQGGGTPMPGLSAPAATSEPAPGDAAANKVGKKVSVPSAAPSERRAGSVEGKVAVTGGPLEDVYVYVDNVRGPAASHKGIEIRQEGRQFSPRVAVVQSGTNVVFPNFDSVYHNVFSNSPRNTFDLGTYQSGDKPRSVTVTGPGVVEIFCNLHQKMSAKILVVPSALYTKVRADGTFRLDNVPPGPRRLVAWSPETKPVAQRVDVNGGTSEISFSLEHQEAGAHTNKLGQAYGSYRD